MIKHLHCTFNQSSFLENAGSNSITSSLSKHGDELQSQANIHKNGLLTDPYNYSKTTVSNEIPPTPPVPQPRNMEQGCNLADTENIQFSKFNPIYSQPISQQCYSTYMEPAQCQPTYYPTSQHVVMLRCRIVCWLILCWLHTSTILHCTYTVLL